MGINYAPASWTPGEFVTAEKLNKEVRDPLTNLQAAWTPFKPAWRASETNPILNNGILVGAYMQVGKTVEFRLNLTVGSSTALGQGNYTFTFPVPTLAADCFVSACWITGPDTVGIARSVTTTTFSLSRSDTFTTMTNSNPGWMRGTHLVVNGVYEAEAG